MEATVKLKRKNSIATRISMGSFRAVDFGDSDEVDVHFSIAADLADGDQFVVVNDAGFEFATVQEMMAFGELGS